MGFILGLLIMSVAVRVFTVNSFDFEAYQHGTRLILQGINPWRRSAHPRFLSSLLGALFMASNIPSSTT
jgi:hypothetical protein